MKRKLFFQSYLFLGIVFLFLSCQENVKQMSEIEKNVAVVDTAVIENIKRANSLADIFEQKRVVRLETKDDSYLSEIVEVFIDDISQSIIILDASFVSFFIFDKDGKYKSKIQKKGNGPGEYLVIYSATCEKNKIYIQDLTKIHVYDLSGNFLDSYELITAKKYFFFDKIEVINDNIYGYQNAKRFNVDGDVAKYSLIDKKITHHFGNAINNFQYGCHLMTVILNRFVLYSGRYHNEIIQIDINDNSVKTFAKLNVKKLPASLLNIKNYQEQLMWLEKNKNEMEEFNPFLKMYNVDDFVFLGKYVEKTSKRKGFVFDVFDPNGNFINTLEAFEFDKRQLDVLFEEEPRWHIYKGGLILDGFEKGRESNANQTLIFYELKK